jgi:hypothetical protein
VSGVDKVSLEMEGDLDIQVGDEEQLIVEAEDNLLPYILTEVRGGRLTIHTQNGADLRALRPVRFHLTVTGLEALEITSSGDITSEPLQAERFDIRVTSSGDLNLAGLSASNLGVEITSSGDVNIAGGQVSEMNARLSSSGNFETEGLPAQRANVTLSSSGDARIRVSDALQALLSSSGNLYYHGDPDLDVTATSSGEAIRVGE